MNNREWAERAMRAGVQPAEAGLDQTLNQVAKLFAEHEKQVREDVFKALVEKVLAGCRETFE